MRGCTASSSRSKGSRAAARARRSGYSPTTSRPVAPASCNPRAGRHAARRAGPRHPARPGHRPVPMSELFLLEAARAQLVARVVEPALAAGRLCSPIASRTPRSPTRARRADSASASSSSSTRPHAARRAGAARCSSTSTVESRHRAGRGRSSTTARASPVRGRGVGLPPQGGLRILELARRHRRRIRSRRRGGLPDEVHGACSSRLKDILP